MPPHGYHRDPGVVPMGDVHDHETAVAEPVVTTRTATRPRSDPSTKTRRQPPYNVVILNDEEHTFDYVIDLLTKLFRHSLPTAEGLTWRIHSTGRAVVYTTHKEKAELKRDQVLAWGPDPRMSVSKGPLGCYIEPAPTD
jgi:ATP-dependent Clp protease adaptor protein ClpS